MYGAWFLSAYVKAFECVLFHTVSSLFVQTSSTFLTENVAGRGATVVWPIVRVVSLYAHCIFFALAIFNQPWKVSGRAPSLFHPVPYIA